MAHPLEGYLRELKELHDSGLGQDEPPYYRHLAALLDAVRCVIHPRSIGAGLPDGGLFTRDQLDKAPGGRWRAAIPARGAVERGEDARIHRMFLKLRRAGRP